MSTINEINTQIQNAMKSGDRDQIKELMKKRKDLMAKSTANIKSTSKRKREREEELCGICQFPLSEPVEGLIKAGKWTASEREKAECFSCATMTDAQYINSTNLDYSCFVPLHLGYLVHPKNQPVGPFLTSSLLLHLEQVAFSPVGAGGAASK